MWRACARWGIVDRGATETDRRTEPSFPPPCPSACQAVDDPAIYKPVLHAIGATLVFKAFAANVTTRARVELMVRIKGGNAGHAAVELARIRAVGAALEFIIGPLCGLCGSLREFARKADGRGVRSVGAVRLSSSRRSTSAAPPPPQLPAPLSRQAASLTASGGGQSCWPPQLPTSLPTRSSCCGRTRWCALCHAAAARAGHAAVL